mgnify:CR=1 FL=1
MAIKVRILEQGTLVELSADKVTVGELLKMLNLNASENVVLKGKTILTEDDVVVDGEEVVVFTVKSGG